MSATDGTGLTKNKAFRIRLRLVRGGKALVLTGYTVTSTARFNTTKIAFVPTTTVIDSVNGIIELSGTSVQMGDAPTASDWLDIELAFAGTPVINPNSKPVRIPVRPLYGEFVAP